jgi:hypothetical protein
VVAPGTTIVTPSVFVIDKSACGASVVVSVAVLFPGVGSVTPPGAATAAVLTNTPVADGAMVAVRVNVAAPPTSRFTVIAMLPVPLVTPHNEPGEATHVHIAPVSAGGRGSVTSAPVTPLGPLLLTTIAYVIDVPGTTVVPPFVFMIVRSAFGVSVALALVTLFPGVGSVTPVGGATDAVLTSVPVADGAMVAVRMNVAAPPTKRGPGASR